MVGSEPAIWPVEGASEVDVNEGVEVPVQFICPVCQDGRQLVAFRFKLLRVLELGR